MAATPIDPQSLASELVELGGVATLTTVNRWLRRGDGIAVYENQLLGSPELGTRKYVSYGSSEAQLEVDIPPTRLPDIGGTINWRYCLVGTHRGAQLELPRELRDEVIDPLAEAARGGWEER